MPSFQHDAVEIDYFDEGEGDPVVLVHGFASNKEVNWAFPGWVSTLRRAGKRVIALDNRGHGRSTKQYRPEDYTIALMASDVRALVGHLALPRADFIGYSLGARIGALLAGRHGDIVRSVVLAGVGASLIRGRLITEIVATALEAPSLEDVADPRGRAFRAFAEQTRSDLKALAACIRGSDEPLTIEEAQAIRVPVLIAVGSKDDVAGPPGPLAEAIPGAGVLDIPNRDHMRAVGDKVYKTGVVDFLSRRP